MKKAIIIVYHGSHNEEYNDRTSTKLTSKVKDNFKDFEVFEVFTSLIVQQRLKNKRFNFLECLNKLSNDNIDEVYILTTNLINGYELETIKKQLNDYSFSYKITPALLEKSSSLKKVAQVLKCDDNSIHLFVGHGSKRKSNHEYLNLEKSFIENGLINHRICVIDGKPSFDDVKDTLDLNKKIYLYPLMFIAGYHANKDVKGLANDLIAKDINAEYVNQSLGMIEEIRDIYLQNLQEIIWE
ncbi:sirohydrochlorin cobaltochelatase [Bacilli bacterium PM5-9]|nr:sirohydrochlorin cobaltochelatase [Bacilli bacterium PM5-9]